MADGLRYSEDHLWFRMAHGHVTAGITDEISRVLTWVNGVDLPAAGARLAAGDELAAIDSQKAVFILSAPVSLEILAVNEALFADPMLVRLEPDGRGWLVEVSLESGGWERLLDPDAYSAALWRSRQR